jgi:hypothetical protein
MSIAAIGKRHWAISAGAIPSRSSGEEPAFTSRDQIALLNASGELANVRIRILYAEREEIGPFRLGVAPRRLRTIRINDLIFPQAVRLDEPYGLLVDSDVPIVVQFTRVDTRAAANAGLMTMGFAAD